MDENLIGYLLNALDPETLRAVEQYLRESPEARQKLEVLRPALAPLALDREPPAAPADLATETLRRLAAPPSQQPPRVFPTRTSPVSRGRWRRADVAIAASILLAVLLMVPPAVMYVKHLARRTECANNLAEIGKALRAYEDDRGYLPHPDKERDGRFAVAGYYGPELRDKGYWNQASMRVACPANVKDRSQGIPPTWKELQESANCPTSGYAEACKKMGGCYAYNLGYIDKNGKLQPIRRQDFDADIPVLADRSHRPGEAGHDDPKANSPNHGGHGQNVLYYPACNVRYERTRLVNGDDIFRNRHGQLAPGVERRDAVLAPSDVSPFKD